MGEGAGVYEIVLGVPHQKSSEEGAKKIPATVQISRSLGSPNKLFVLGYRGTAGGDQIGLIGGGELNRADQCYSNVVYMPHLLPLNETDTKIRHPPCREVTRDHPSAILTNKIPRPPELDLRTGSLARSFAQHRGGEWGGV